MSLNLLEQTGAFRVLVRVLGRPRYITELKRSSVNPEGIVSLDALKIVRANLSDLGLVTKEMEQGPRPKTFLTITEKRRRVAQKIRENQEILEEWINSLNNQFNSTV